MYFFGVLNTIGLIVCFVFIPNILNEIKNEDEEGDFQDIEN